MSPPDAGGFASRAAGAAAFAARAADLDLDGFAIDPGVLAGPLAQRLRHVVDAGFRDIVLHAADLAGDPAGCDDAVAMVRDGGLRVVSFVGIEDPHGLHGPARRFRLAAARPMIEFCARLGARNVQLRLGRARRAALDVLDLPEMPDVLAVPELADPDATDARVDDLRRLALMAIPYGIRIGCVPAPGDDDAAGLLRLGRQIAATRCPNLGIVLDLAAAAWRDAPDAARGSTGSGAAGVADASGAAGASGASGVSGAAGVSTGAAASPQRIDALDIGRLHAVRIAERFTPAGGARLFPGEGGGPIEAAPCVRLLHRRGFDGPWLLDADAPEYRSMPPATVLAHARRAALRLGEDVLRRSAPLPGSMIRRAPRSGAATPPHDEVA